MSLNIASAHGKVYSVTTPIYEGPLDLLLQLIERSELDITRLSLAQVTDQYLGHIHLLKENATEEVSAFIVIAARLIQIKSEALLPRPPQREPGEEDPGETLAEQLRIYRRFKLAAQFLESRDDSGLRSHLRLAPPPRIEGRIDLTNITLLDLALVAREIFSREDTKISLSEVVAAPRITIREKISHIIRSLSNHGRTTFRSLFSKVTSRLEIVVTFLAMLELVKRHYVYAHQEHLFGDIALEYPENEDEVENNNIEFELEFGE